MRNLAEFPITTDEIVGTLEEIIDHESTRMADGDAYSDLTALILREALARIERQPPTDKHEDGAPATDKTTDPMQELADQAQELDMGYGKGSTYQEPPGSYSVPDYAPDRWRVAFPDSVVSTSAIRERFTDSAYLTKDGLLAIINDPNIWQLYVISSIGAVTRLTRHVEKTLNLLTSTKDDNTTDAEREAKIRASENNLAIILDMTEVSALGPLEGYETYSVPDWDGYGAAPITARTVAAARQFLALLDPHRPPDVAPGGDGSVGFEWHLEGGPIATLIVDFGDDGVFAEATDRDSAKVNVNAVYVTNEPLPNEGNVGLAMNVASTALHLADDAQACVSNPNKANVEDMLASMRIMRHRMERAMRELGEEW